MKVSKWYALLRHTGECGLRDYGLEPTVWDGVEGCEHVWGDTEPGSNRGGAGTQNKSTDGQVAQYGRAATRGQFCQRCGAWRGVLGLEPTISLYLQHLVGIFEQVKRVLRSDGVVFCNISDSYASSGRSPRHESPGVGAKQSMDAPGREIIWKAGGGHNFSWTLPGNIKPKDLCLIPFRLAIALQDAGWWVRSDIIWSKPNPMPESVTDRPGRSHEYVFLLTKSARYFWDAGAVREAATHGRCEWQENAYGQLREASPTDKRQNKKGRHTGKDNDASAGRNLRSVWTIPTAPYKNSHFATFPPALVERCIKAGTSERGCCAACGAPWTRVVERTYVGDWSKEVDRMGKGQNQAASGENVVRVNGSPYRKGYSPHTTTGWLPACSCNAETVPCTVLDPFAGAGTVGLVADRLGRDAVLIEAKPEYCEMARKRIRGDAPLLHQTM